MSKKRIERRLDSLEECPTDRLSPAEYWEREICDDLDDPQEPWEQWFRGMDQ